MLIPIRVPVRRQADPFPPYSLIQQFVLIESLLVLEHEVHCPAQFVGKDGQSLRFAMFVGEPVRILFRRLITLDKEDRSFGESPFEVSVSDFTAARTTLLAIGFFDTLNETTI